MYVCINKFPFTVIRIFLETRIRPIPLAFLKLKNTVLKDGSLKPMPIKEPKSRQFGWNDSKP
jgi:hypothetical protein